MSQTPHQVMSQHRLHEAITCTTAIRHHHHIRRTSPHSAWSQVYHSGHVPLQKAFCSHSDKGSTRRQSCQTLRRPRCVELWINNGTTLRQRISIFVQIVHGSLPHSQHQECVHNNMHLANQWTSRTIQPNDPRLTTIQH